MKNINKHTGLIIYLISIIALTYFGFFPKGRVWGINIWGYFELLLLFGFFAIFSLLGFAVLLGRFYLLIPETPFFLLFSMNCR